MLLMFGVGLHFSLDDLLAVRKVALPGAVRADGGGHGARRGRRALLVGLAAGRGAGVRPGAVGRQHGRAAAGAGGARRARFGATAASRSAGSSSRTWRWCWCWCCCRRSRGALGGTRDRGQRRQRSGSTLGHDPARRSRAFIVADAGGRPARVPVGAVAGRRRPARASCSRCASWPPRWASPTARRSCSACRSRSAPSSPAWCCANRSSATAPPRRSLPLRDAFAVLFFVSVGMLFDPAVLVDRAAARAGGRRDHRGRQVARRGGARAAAALSAAAPR